MLEITKEQLDNFWKVRDVCQEVSNSLNNLMEQSSESEKSIINNDCVVVASAIEKMSALGYFNKKQVSQELIKELVESIIKIELKNSELTAKIWEKEITSINDYTNSNFKLCVAPANDKTDFLICRLISDKNIYIPSNNYTLDKKLEFSFGYIYDIKNNFIAATDEGDSVVIKKKSDITSADFLPVATTSDCALYLNGYATKLKTPNDIIKKNSNYRFTTNNNVVVLKGDAPAIGVYVYTHPLSKISSTYKQALQLANDKKLPLVEVDVVDFYKRNAKYASDKNVLRKCFNDLVDVIVCDIKQYCGIDSLQEAKRLIGFNTNLRYNFLYKLFINISKKDISFNKENITKIILKSIEKRNILQKEREKQNGGPLVYPTDSMPVALPVEFVD